MAPNPSDDRSEAERSKRQKRGPSQADAARPGSQGDHSTFDGWQGRSDTTSLGDLVTVGGGSSQPPLGEDGLEIVDLTTRYRFERILGRGGMGEVTLALDTRLNRKVAIKRILGQVAQDRVAVQRFMTEARTIAALNHPNIVQIHDFGRTVDGPFLIMEYVDGGSLADRCATGPLPLDLAHNLLTQLCDGLSKAHSMGIIHRDIKPANILLTSDGVPKLTDFGLAKIEAAEFGMTLTGAILGTLDFMPPEQRKSADRVDARSDLWSLAATAYTLLTGESPRTIRLDRLPTPWRPLLSRGLEESPDRRFGSAVEFRQALDELTGTLKAGAPAVIVGQCPHCQSLNEPQRRFCHNCSQPMTRLCQNCRSEVAVWYDVCGECGSRHSDWLAQNRLQLSEWKGQAEFARTKMAPTDSLRVSGRERRTDSMVGPICSGSGTEDAGPACRGDSLGSNGFGLPASIRLFASRRCLGANSYLGPWNDRANHGRYDRSVIATVAAAGRYGRAA